MLWANLTKNISRTRVIIVLFFVICFFLTRVPRLYNDTINPDGVNWHYRSQQFMNGLKYGDLTKTYQHYHPGVTLMWVTAPAIEIYKQFPGNSIYTIYNFQGFDFVAKYALVLAQLIITLFIIYFLAKIFPLVQVIIIVSLFTFEPFFVGNSRLFHMDILVTLLIFLSLIVSYLANNKDSKILYSLAGLTSGLAFLTKSISIMFPILIIGYFLVIAIYNKRFTVIAPKLVLFIISMVITVYLFLPALWIRPVFYIQNIFEEGLRVGVRKGHEVVVMGETLDSGGLLYYPLVFLVKLSPFLWFGVLYALFLLGKYVKNNRNKQLIQTLLKPNLSVMLVVFYITYIVVMSLPAKKLDRYMLIPFPLFAYLTYLSLIYAFSKVKNKTYYYLTTSLLVGIFILLPLIRLFPYYFTYSSPLFGSPTNANKYLGQKPFGIGVYDLKDFILLKYGYYPSVGVLDFKPLESIYPNRLVQDIREASMDSYDLAILGPNEEFPEKVKKGRYNLIQDSSIEINGLEYWRIYVKRSK